MCPRRMLTFFNTVQHAQAKMVGPKTTLKVSTRSYFLNGFFMEYGSKCLWFKGITIDFIPYLKKVMILFTRIRRPFWNHWLYMTRSEDRQVPIWTLICISVTFQFGQIYEIEVYTYSYYSMCLMYVLYIIYRILLLYCVNNTYYESAVMYI